MGDRAQVFITEDGTTGVYLYTHWDGSELPTMLARALDNGRDRWDDAPYLARIIFDEMTDHSHSETTGYGVWHQSQDSSEPIVVNVTDQTVSHQRRLLSLEEFIARERMGREKR